MTTIIAGQDARFTAVIRTDGAAISIADNAAVSARLFSEDGLTALFDAFSLSKDAAGADWSKGVVTVSLDSGVTGSLPNSVMLVVSGPNFVKRFRLDVSQVGVPIRSALFVRDFIVDELREDRLQLMAKRFFSKVTLSDDFIWSKIVAAESDIAHTLRVPLCPTQFFANPPSDAEIEALGGMPWALDPAYDYDPGFFQGERWGFIVTRQKPLISVSRIRFVYPGPTTGFYEIPNDWIRMDRKYGHIRLVPASSVFIAPLGAFVMQALGGGRTIPFAIELTYQAGITNAAQTYPELLDAVKKKAVLKIIEDGFIPQSGSISGDGLSQSISVDMEKYRDTIDHILNGPKGSNGGLMTAIHGIRSSVLGT